MTTEDLRRLPLRAIVAVAARSAARFQQWYDLPGAAPERARLMDGFRACTQAAMKWVAGADLPADLGEMIAAAQAAAEPAPEDMSGVPATRGWMAAALAREAVGRVNLNNFPDRATLAFRRSAEAARDVAALLDMDLGRFPEAGRPFDPTPAGPLGPY